MIADPRRVTSEELDALCRRWRIIELAAFGSVFSFFPIILAIVVFLFAYSTMISWSYYGEKGWAYLFGKRSLLLYRLLFLGAVVLVGAVHMKVVGDLSGANAELAKTQA